MLKMTSTRYGCCLVTAADNIPVAATFTPAKKVDQETATRVAVEKPIWMLGNAEFDMLDWHDRLLEQGVVPVVPYNQRNATDPLDIEYRVEDTIAVSKERLDEAYRKQPRIETAIGVCKDLGPGTPRSRSDEDEADAVERVLARVEAYPFEIEVLLADSGFYNERVIRNARDIAATVVHVPKKGERMKAKLSTSTSRT